MNANHLKEVQMRQITSFFIQENLKHSITSRKPFTHNCLKKWFPFQIPFFSRKLDSQLLAKFGRLLFLNVHHAIKNFVDWIQNELTKSTFSIRFLSAGPLLCFEVEEAITPKILHQLVDLK
uniref:Uncharacterized protein n=1 Tax=Meloidogyne incognita TaxID=6306 RepID=A0A914MT67_MELIC